MHVARACRAIPAATVDQCTSAAHPARLNGLVFGAGHADKAFAEQHHERRFRRPLLEGHRHAGRAGGLFRYRRKVFVGPSPALLAVDLYEWSIAAGRGRRRSLPRPIRTPAANMPMPRSSRPSGCLPRRARAGLPIFYSTGDTRAESRPSFVTATKRNKPPVDPADFAIRPEFKPQPQDVVITKQRASVFFGTPLVAHLTQLGVQTLIICGESTSGCVRATAVDAYSLGFHVVLVEECCFDRSILSHKVNLFDMHHKYVRRDARRARWSRISTAWRSRRRAERWRRRKAQSSADCTSRRMR